MGRLHRHLLVFTFFLVVCLHAGGVSARPQRQPDFITAACSNTLYPDVCVSGLSRYAAAIPHNSVRRLARAALRETLTRARSASASVNRLSSGGSARPAGSREAAGAFSDCVQSLANSVQLLWRSLWQLEHLGRARAARYRYHVSNVQAWLSAALTYQTTCLDAFPGSGVRTTAYGDAVKRQLDYVSRMNSVALALVSKMDGAQQ